MKKKMNKILFWIIVALVVAGVSVGAVIIYENAQNDSEGDEGIVVKKPAIYIYPIQDSNISIKLNINGKLTQTIPDYNSGWDVFVTKEGIINNQYDYLFYEADLNKIELPEDGWVVKYSELDKWFDMKLIELGLNEKEKNQFKEYWMNELPKSEYYEIKLLSDEFLKENMDISFSSQPDTLIRLDFNFKPLKKKINLTEPNIITPERIGFTIVEWGGILEN